MVQQRFNYSNAAPGVYEAMNALDQYLQGCGLGPRLVYLIQLRSSQLNGCAYCIDMHWKDLRAARHTTSAVSFECQAASRAAVFHGHDHSR